MRIETSGTLLQRVLGMADNFVCDYKNLHRGPLLAPLPSVRQNDPYSYGMNNGRSHHQSNAEGLGFVGYRGSDQGSDQGSEEIVSSNRTPGNHAGHGPQTSAEQILYYGATSPLSIVDITSLTEQPGEENPVSRSVKLSVNPQQTSQNLGSLAQRGVQGGVSEAVLQALINGCS